MIERLVARSLEHRRLVLLLVGLLAAAGGASSLRLRLDALPDTTGKQVVVLTRAPGFTPEEIERLVTRPIESAIGGVPELATQRSISR